MSLRFFFRLFVIVLTLAPLSWGQDSGVRRRPKIGLALEGGGALGLAHVGLLEWFAQHHIPIDYIAGASMGGLVAGFYASGMTPSEMHSTVDHLDWNVLVNGEPDDLKLAYRRKEDVRALGSETVLGLRHGLILPTGLNSGQGLNLLLSKISAPYGELSTFDDMPTPFRCIATDLVAAQAHVFEKGSLLEALRATMSIPGVYDPIVDGKHEYVDGGLLNNLPVDVVKAMGADVVIAVYLATDPFDPNKPQTLITVLSRSLSAVIAANERHNIETADLLVSINLSGLSATDFSKYGAIIQRGLDGAQKKEVVLSKFALGDADWSVYVRQRREKRKTTVAAPQFVEIQGVDQSLAAVIRPYFAAVAGKPFDPLLVEAQIQKIMGLNVFSSMAYDLVERHGQTGLVIYVRPSPSRPPTLQPTMLVDGSDYRNTRFAVAARLSLLDFGGFRSELRTDFVAGSAYGIRSEYYRPFSAQGHWFIAPRAFAYTRPIDFYRRSQILSLNRERSAGGGADLGYTFSNIAELRFGYEAGHFESSYLLGDRSLFRDLNGRYGASHVGFTLDRVDDEIVPQSGVLGHADFRWVDANPGAYKSFPVLTGDLNLFKSLPGKSNLFFSVEGGTLFNRQNSGVPLFYLGGPQRLSAYGVNELYGNEFTLARAGYLRQIGLISSLTNDKAYYVVDYEVGKMFGFAPSTHLPMDVNTGILLKTVLGPVFIGGSVGDAGHRKIYFQLGRFF